MSDWKEAGTFDGETWKPENAGDSITGLFVKAKTNIGMNNSNMYYIEKEGAEEPTAVWGSTVLDTKFEDIELGQLVKIEFLGPKKGNGPKPYKDFKVMYRDAPVKTPFDNE